MNSIEQAIRAALSKGDVSDDAFRSRIYASASAALERSILARPFTESEISARRSALDSTVRSVESEFIIAVEEDVSLASIQEEAFQSAVEVNVAHELPEQTYGNQTHENQPYENRVLPAESRQKKNLKANATSKPFRTLAWQKYAINGFFLLAVIIGGFWLYREAVRIYEQATSPVPAGQAPVLAEPSINNIIEDESWIAIFSARDTDLLSPASGALVEIADRDGKNYVVMTGDSSNEIAIKIGSGLVQNFAGKRILFNIKARSLKGLVLETGLRCDFGMKTKCERKRFKVGPEATELMFAVNIDASANGDGALLIAPDLTNAGGPVEVESIRATIVVPEVN